MEELNKQYRQMRINSYRKTLNLQKITRVGTMKEHKLLNTTKLMTNKPEKTSANSHLLALIFLNKDYKAMLKSFSSPQAFWAQMIRLTNEFVPGDYSKQKSKISHLVGQIKVNTPNPGKDEAESIVKVFNDGKYDEGVAFLIKRRLPVVFQSCIKELVIQEAEKTA